MPTSMGIAPGAPAVRAVPEVSAEPGGLAEAPAPAVLTASGAPAVPVVPGEPDGSGALGALAAFAEADRSSRRATRSGVSRGRPSRRMSI